MPVVMTGGVVCTHKMIRLSSFGATGSIISTILGVPKRGQYQNYIHYILKCIKLLIYWCFSVPIRLFCWYNTDIPDH